MKEGYRGAKSAHCRLRKSLPSIRVQFGGCDSVEGSLTNSFSGSLLFQCHTSRFEGQDVEIVLLKILPIPPVWTMVGVLPNFQHSLYHLPVSFLITSYVSCMHYLLYNQQQIFGVMWKFEFIAHMSGFIWGTAGWLCWTVLDFHVWGCLVFSWSRLLGWWLWQLEPLAVLQRPHPPTNYLQAFFHGSDRGMESKPWWVSPFTVCVCITPANLLLA